MYMHEEQSRESVDWLQKLFNHERGLRTGKDYQSSSVSDVNEGSTDGR
jgi:hypothetical protein